MGLTFGSLFAGIGGIDLGLERAGMECKWQGEVDDFCTAVLEEHWPHVRRARDIRECHSAEACPMADASLTGRQARGGDDERAAAQPVVGLAPCGDCEGCLEPVDLIAGGFPCQPYSVAGRQRGAADERALWPEFARIIGLLRPRYVLIENVPGLLAADDGRAFAGVLSDLAALGFDAEWDCIPAAAVGAPHLRWRVFIVAYTEQSRLEGRQLSEQGRGVSTERRGQKLPAPPGGGDPLADTTIFGRPRPRQPVAPSEPTSDRDGEAGEPLDGRLADQWLIESRLGRGPYGISAGLDCWGEGWEDGISRVATGVPQRVQRLRALGNAVVPQVAEYVGRLIADQAA